MFNLQRAKRAYYSMDINWNILSNKIIESNSIVLSTHINPDGDGLGSELAMFYYLKSIFYYFM